MEMMLLAVADAGVDRSRSSSSGFPLLRWLPEMSDLFGFWVSIALILFASVHLAWWTRFLILRCRRVKLVTSHTATATYSSDNDSSDDDDDSETDEVEEDVELSSSEDELGDSGKGQGQVVDFADMGGGGAVVKTWEGFGIGFDRRGAGGLISLLDLNRGEVLRSYAAGAGEIVQPVVGLASPAMLVSSAGDGEAVRVWDARVESQIPAAAADWRRRGARQRRRVVKIAGDGGKRVFLGGDDGAVAVADLRGGRSPATETWWDADAVIVDDGDAMGPSRGRSVVSWCRNAVRCLPLLPSPK